MIFKKNVYFKNSFLLAPPSVDSFLSHLGDPGRFQIVVMFLLASNCIPVVVNHLLMAFYAVTAPHNCRVPEEFALNKSVLLPTKEGCVALYYTSRMHVQIYSSFFYHS